MKKQTLLSSLWVFVMFNILAADILSFMYPGFLKEVMSGNAGQVQITPEFLLIAAVLLEVPIAMIVLSRLLPDRINRWVNIFAAILTILFVVGGGSSYPHYIFFEIIEVITMLIIIRIAWKINYSER